MGLHSGAQQHSRGSSCLQQQRLLLNTSFHILHHCMFTFFKPASWHGANASSFAHAVPPT